MLDIFLIAAMQQPTYKISAAYNDCGPCLEQVAKKTLSLPPGVSITHGNSGWYIDRGVNYIPVIRPTLKRALDDLENDKY